MLKETPQIFAISALKGLVVLGTDGRIGTVKDFLFLDNRWLVIDTGGWLPGRKVLIQPLSGRRLGFRSTGDSDSACQTTGRRQSRPPREPEAVEGFGKRPVRLLRLEPGLASRLLRFDGLGCDGCGRPDQRVR